MARTYETSGRPGTPVSIRNPSEFLASASSQHFRGEEEREIGFRNTASAVAPGWSTFELTETEGLDATITEQLDHIADTRTIDAVYSIGGGNQATLATLERHNQNPGIYIAHAHQDHHSLQHSDPVGLRLLVTLVSVVS